MFTRQHAFGCHTTSCISLRTYSRTRMKSQHLLQAHKKKYTNSDSMLSCELETKSTSKPTCNIWIILFFLNDNNRLRYLATSSEPYTYDFSTSLISDFEPKSDHFADCRSEVLKNPVSLYPARWEGFSVFN